METKPMGEYYSLASMKARMTRILVVGPDVDHLRELIPINTEGLYPEIEFLFESNISLIHNRLKEEKINLVLVELDPGLKNPLMALRSIVDVSSGIPLILLAGENRKQFLLDALREGVEDYLITGELDERILMHTILHVLERSRAQKTPSSREYELFRLRQEHQAVLRGTTTGLCMLNPDWRIRWINEAMERLLNPDREATQSLIGLPLQCFFENTAEFEAYCQEVRKGIGEKGIDVREIKLSRLDGSQITGEVSIVRIDPSHTDPGFVVSIYDISERNKAVKELTTLSQVAKQTGDVILITDRDGKIEYVNPAFEEVTGYPKEEIIGHTPRILKSGLQPREFYQNLWDTILSGKVFRGVLVNRKKNGYLYYDEQTISPIRDRKGTITHFVSTARDITERKVSEENLLKKNREIQQMKMKYKAILRSTPNGLCMLSSDWIILWANHAMNMILHPSAVSTQNEGGFSLRVLFEDQKRFDDYRKEVHACLRKKGIDLRELKLKRGDGSPFWAEISIVRLDPSETGGGYVATLKDITERKRLAGELKRKERLAVIGQTISGISHNMKNLITVLLGGISLLDSSVKDRNWSLTSKALDMLNNSTKRLFISLKNMLDYTRNREIKKESTSITGVFKEVIDMLEECSPNQEIVITSRVKPEAGTWKLDPECLFRALLNLGTNALDAIEEQGMIRFTSSLVDINSESMERYGLNAGKWKAKPHALLIEVDDTGSGIPGEDMEKIYDPFFSKKGARGTGLGLVTVRQFVEDHNGEIHVKSGVGRGTRFLLFLP